MPAFKNLLAPRSIGQRFAIAIGAGAGAVLIALGVANYISGRELLLDQASKEAIREVHDEIGNWDDLIERIAMLPRVIAATEGDGDAESQVTVPWLATLLKRSTGNGVYGIYMAREKFDWRDPSSYAWVDRKSWPHAARFQYDFHDPKQDWYQGAKVNKGIHVTLPYFDEGGSDIDMISITKAVHDSSGKFQGVAGADVSMAEMEKIVGEMHLRDFGTNIFFSRKHSPGIVTGDSGTGSPQSAYLISKAGAVIIGPRKDPWKHARDPNGRRAEKIPGNLAEHGLELTAAHLEEILSSETGWMRVGEHGDKLIYWAQSRITGWKLILEVPYSMIISPARHLAEESIIIGGCGLLVLMGVVVFTARKISEPITSLQSVASNFERGFYQEGREVIDRIVKRRDELGRFAKSFSMMAREIRLREERLSEWNANLEQTVKDRTAALALAMEKVEKTNAAMAAELAEAAAYSRAILPGKLNGPVNTDWVFVTSSQLGGDSFGYHWLDDDTLSLYLLDVCGHGVGAALLSISVVNVLRTGSLPGTDFRNPDAVLGHLNASFPMENHTEMYFTAWYGVYTRSTRELRFASGGHPPAVLVAPEGLTVHLSAKGPVLGAFPNAAYAVGTVRVTPGSRLYLFSDGTYEIDRPGALMMTHGEFSDILSSPDRTGGLDAVVTEVRRQQRRDDFADDFSLVEFQFPEDDPSLTPPDSAATGAGAGDRPGNSEIALRAELAELGKLPGFLSDFCRREALPGSIAFDFEVILEELATNVMKYGGGTGDSACCFIELSRKDDELTIRFSDTGAPFNPLEKSEVDTAKPIEEREIGGLGIHFIRKLSDTQHYEYRDGKNILTLTKRVPLPVDFEV